MPIDFQGCATRESEVQDELRGRSSWDDLRLWVSLGKFFDKNFLPFKDFGLYKSFYN